MPSLTRIRQACAGKRLAIILSMCGLIGLSASFVLTIDAFNLAASPGLQLDCNLNPILSCGSVMKTQTASLFGFANSIIGLPAFTAVLVIGATSLGGTVYSRWVWLCILAGAFLGNILTHYLMYHSLYVIHALCPYCMAVWVITMVVFWYTLIYCLQQNYLAFIPPKISRFMLAHHVAIYVMWLILIAALIIVKFWYYIGPRI